MAAPTQLQLTAMEALMNDGPQSSQGAFLTAFGGNSNHPLYNAIAATCGEYSLYQGSGVDLYTGFLMWNDLADGTLIPDSSSDDCILAFVGRCREFYEIQNPV